MTTLPIIFSTSEDNDKLPLICKFDEKVDMLGALKPVRMGFKEVQLMEEPIDEGRKDTEQYKRKKQRRKSLKATSTLMIEDSTHRDNKTPLRGLIYEGKLTNLNVLDSTSGGPTPYQAKQKARSVTEAPFKFILLQPRINIIDVKQLQQILMTPVGGITLYLL